MAAAAFLRTTSAEQFFRGDPEPRVTQ